MAGKPKQSQITNETVPIQQIDAHPMNYNAHPPEQIAGLRTSLRTFGQVQTVVVQRQKDGRFTAVAGHGLMEAAQLEGFKELDCRVIPEDWPHEKVIAYLAADNEHARHSQRDDIQLASILQEARDFDKALLAAAGYSDAEYMELLKQVGEGDTAAKLKPVDVAKPPPDMVWVLIGIPVVKFGSIANIIDKVANNPDAIVEMTTNNEDRGKS